MPNISISYEGQTYIFNYELENAALILSTPETFTHIADIPNLVDNNLRASMLTDLINNIPQDLLDKLTEETNNLL